MRHELEYYAKEYEHGWTIWIRRDNKKFQLASAIKSEDEVDRIVLGIGLSKEHLTTEVKLKHALGEVERLKVEQNELESESEYLRYQLSAANILF